MELEIIIIVFCSTVILQLLMYYFKDRKLIATVKSNPDPEKINLSDLKEIPLITIIIPAWKEGIEFKECIMSILSLKYPKLKIIINDGGNEMTINTANSLIEFDNFIILRQTGGHEKAALGKIKALNECLEYITEGIVFFIDADCYVRDEYLLRMIAPIVNEGEYVVVGAGLRPLITQERIDLVKYLHFSRFGYHKYEYNKYYEAFCSGANTCMEYEVIKEIGKFNDKRGFAEDSSRGIDVASKGFKIRALNDVNTKIFTKYPSTIKEHVKQRYRYMENIFKVSDMKGFIKLSLVLLCSIYLLITPVLIFVNFYLFLIGLIIFTNIYLIRLRLYVNMRKIEGILEYRIVVFIKMVYYIYVEMLSNIYFLIRGRF